VNKQSWLVAGAVWLVDRGVFVCGVVFLAHQITPDWALLLLPILLIGVLTTLAPVVVASEDTK
jgi:hypothetical protein